MSVPVLTLGCKAFVDSFAGLLPCVVQSLSGPAGPACSAQQAKVLVTADLGPYKKGEVLESSALWVIPRNALRRHQYSSTIGFYTVQPPRSSA